MNARLTVVSILGPCQSGVTADNCSSRTSTGPFPGLGQVTGKYTFGSNIGPPRCANGWGKAIAYTVRLSIPSKGEIYFDLAEGAQCEEEETEFHVREQTQTFTVTGGTGMYAGASGVGTVARHLATTATGSASGPETWSGTLIVPGVEFDVTAPTLTGATNKTVRAKKGATSARVTYKLTAQDDKDGALPVTCDPTGSRFRLGKTRVSCEATDSSANTGNATFIVTVKRTR
jgi:HYR domain-containing protein